MWLKIEAMAHSEKKTKRNSINRTVSKWHTFLMITPLLALQQSRRCNQVFSKLLCAHVFAAIFPCTSDQSCVIRSVKQHFLPKLYHTSASIYVLTIASFFLAYKRVEDVMCDLRLRIQNFLYTENYLAVYAFQSK